ncbi:hypothetical protein CTA2_7292 [Colletotrichum tanaceti]|uniref:Uncharacterized protein n=1 Tax=Colletotrichum tanaceti TaxID=1306861 RepID=A0A4U6X5I7_9PEZI|nr:hypothetical protein CTA2_7292 [Colletotrichum tanaceti]TKW50233.1 hypothetical protein CTA1_2299 [Colletotrichum tanaceti]
MSSKRNSGDWTVVSTSTASRRPASVREKLSGFVRRGRGLAKKTTMSVLGESRHERPSLDEDLHPKVLPRVQVRDFGTSSLDIDLLSLEAFRDVLQAEEEKEAEEQRQEKKRKKKPQRTTSSSTTPIADMFARKAATTMTMMTTTTTTTASTIAPTAPAVVDQLPPSLHASSPSHYAPFARKPVRAPAEDRRPGPAAPAHQTAHTAHTAHSSTSGPAVTVTIISSSSHVQAHNPGPWPPPATSRTVAPPRAPQPVPAVPDAKQPARPAGPLLASAPRQHAVAAGVVAGAVAVAEQQRLPRHHHHSHQQERPSAEKRHSTPMAVMPSLSTTTTTTTATTTTPTMTPAPNPSPAEIPRTDRRRSWQPAPTSAPTSAPSSSSTAAAAAPPRPSAPPSASAPWRGIPNRQTSVRLGADRLAWIRELEAGNRNRSRSSVNGDLPVLRTMQGGSVADKLARFESKQHEQEQQRRQQQQPLQKQPPLARSNSTRSRPSSIADTFSSYGCNSGGGGGGSGSAATTRSSLDSHRASSVFSHYDDSFREKLELITGKAADEDKGGEEDKKQPPLTRVTSTFVSVERRRKQACVDKAQPV